MSAPWVSGGRVRSRVIEHHLTAALLRSDREAAAIRAMQHCERIWRTSSEGLGPASGALAVWTMLVRPCAETLGWCPGEDRLTPVNGVPMRTALATLGPSRQVLVAMPWGMSQDGLQRAATRLGADADATWVAVCIAQSAVDARVWQVLWMMGQAARSTRERHGRVTPWLERLVTASSHEGAGDARALRDGVTSALAELSRLAAGNHSDHVRLAFQWLFLLFAESRAIAPAWHPALRRSYSLTTLARECQPPRRQPSVGIHESLVAIGRLGREGAVAAGARVAPLNGPLFSGTLQARHGGRIRDDALAAMLGALTHGDAEAQRTPIDYAQLDVEHLGSVYEGLMAPEAARGSDLLLRKRTGAFYTPRLMADLIVERTLDPLVRTASSHDIFQLRILDPAMGSGALLASAHRYLLAAVEAAWVREGRGGPLDVPRAERESLPRRIAEQCLYGVDVNDTAVQIARLSLWLLSLAPDRPLTWLDAHLRLGNSLIGVSPATLLARAPVRESIARRPANDRQLTLFDLQQWQHEAAEIGPQLAALAARPTDSATDAHEKAQLLEALRSRAVLASWRARADVWCGAAMDTDRPSRGAWRAADDALREGHPAGAHSRRGVASWTRRWSDLAQAERCLHWSLEFPDVFESGRTGFDAVIANPPWEMLRGDLGSGEDRASRRDDLGPLKRFVRHSGLYRDAGGHVNIYQLFLERMLQLLGTGGRLGCLLPGGVLTDHGAGALRRHLFEHAALDRISIFDNRDALFPIHRSMRIVAITASRGPATDAVLVDDGVPRAGRLPNRLAEPRLLPRSLLRRAVGESEAIPALRDAAELGVFEQLLAHPRLGSDWSLAFGRELNATEDRPLLRSGPRPSGAVLVVDGKHLQPFSVRTPDDVSWIGLEDAVRALSGSPWRSWRLAYRDVSAATNSRSLIAALLPPGFVSTHTVFCLRTRLALATQLYLCGMLNSLVADWFVRRYLASHVTTRLMAYVPVPRPPAASPHRRRVVRLAARLLRSPGDERAQCELQVVAAGLYGLDAAGIATVMADFPRVSAPVRDALASVTAATPSTR
jgi:hypothetical protein